MTENIEVLTHSSIRICSQEGTIYCDPYQIREKRQDADYIFITHDHYDHFSIEDIQKVCREGTILIVPEKMESKAEKAFAGVRVRTVRPGEVYDIEGLKAETIAAYNNRKPFHPKAAGWTGYILNIDGQRIYIAGDTDFTKDMEHVKCDIAIVPIGGIYTMNAKKAAEFINTIRPAAAIPAHYGSIVGKKEDAEVFAQNVKEPVRVEVKMQYL